ncbi:peptidoglycan editing factor PgeF [Alkalibacter rhizosphaerae]|uniref:Purine nucleoside phosphorylase n=1 Tax=Alkalibacter rhizosphaerae TaxID=2815577 RepID=A0A974XH69_9FIRM|nr:peptidoglycan editing factor PgeF [Alkalibacter rhizosphaerae]QSX08585.1 peptidoglycan editing factor PgeF [Alkalibacter rhizosphaerae]
MTFTQNIGIHGTFGTFTHFQKTELVQHGFTTRNLKNGSTWDLNTKTSDLEVTGSNLAVLAVEMNLALEDLVLSDQVHGNRIREVCGNDTGFGTNIRAEHRGMDGLITNERKLGLVTFYADCVPLFLLDPKNKAIGLAHAGWKGTLLEIGKNALRAMKKAYGTDPADILVGIGPSIGPCCFEIGKDVADIMLDAHPGWVKYMESKSKDKFHVDLWQINRDQFMASGVLNHNIETAALCTKCNDKLYYSYRREGSAAGRMAAIMTLI